MSEAGYRSTLAVDDETREVLHSLREDFPIDDMVAVMREASPELLRLPAESGLLQRAVEAHIDTFFTALENPSAGQPSPTVPRASEALAGELARWGLRAEVMLHAYHVGNVYSLRWMRRRLAERIGSRADLMALVEFCEDVGAVYAEAVMRATIDDYAAAMEAATRGRVAEQLALVRRIMESSEVHDIGALSQRLGYDLALDHLGFVVWSTTDMDDEFSKLERTARAWLTAIDISHPLIMPVDARTLWAWGRRPSASPAHGLNTAPGRDVRATVGQVGRGIEGFRDTHNEAVATLTLARKLNLTDSVILHADVETLLLLDQDPHRALLYVQRKLGRLAADDAATAELRDTLRVYLQSGERVSVAAANGHLHRNTVTRRVEQAIELRGTPLDDDRLGISLALEIEAHHRRMRSTPAPRG